MRATLPIIGLLLTILVAIPASVADEAIVREVLKERFPSTDIVSIHESPWQGWYEVETPAELVYASADGSVLFRGRVYDTATRKDLSLERWDALRAIDFNALPLDLAIKEVRGNGSRRVAVFADPFCPFCRQLEERIRDVDDVTIYTFLFPLEDIHPGATQRAAQLWCSEDRAVAWSKWIVERIEPTAGACDATPLEDIRSLAKKYRISGTPTAVFGSGRRSEGVLTRDKFVEELDKQP